MNNQKENLKNFSILIGFIKLATKLKSFSNVNDQLNKIGNIIVKWANDYCLKDNFNNITNDEILKVNNLINDIKINLNEDEKELFKNITMYFSLINEAIMYEKEELTKKFIMVGMNEMEISTEEKPIIGTQALSSCISFILSNKRHKKAIVGHFSSEVLMSEENLKRMRLELLNLISENNLNNSKFNLKIIQGACKSDYTVYSHELDILNDLEKWEYTLAEVLEENIKRTNITISSISRKQIRNKDIKTVDEYGNCNYQSGATLSKQFAFDATKNQFVTEQVLFGEEYLKVNNQRTFSL